jgi:hypothetical protein
MGQADRESALEQLLGNQFRCFAIVLDAEDFSIRIAHDHSAWMIWLLLASAATGRSP